MNSHWPRITNAKIAKTMLGIEDHGIMSFFVFCDWDGSGGGFGGYALDSFDGRDKPRKGHGLSYQAIRQIIETVGVTSWEKLPGTLVRIEDNGPGRTLTKIGHIIEDRWFDIAAWMADAHDNT